MNTGAQTIPLRGRAEALAGNLPPLLARALRLADGVMLGEHGRRRPGSGDAFWQYRPAVAGDAARAIDWRRSARSDQHFVQQKEWQAAQVVMLWADNSAAMRYASNKSLPQKADRAALLTLALAALLIRGGERVGLPDLPPGAGDLQLARLATAITTAISSDQSPTEYGTPQIGNIPHHSRAVFASDFLGDLQPLETALGQLAERGVKGALVQILDPCEEAFPFLGRTLFESMGAGIRFETRKARDLRERYKDRLAQRKQALHAMTARIGWHYHLHHTDKAASSALLWLFHALEERR